MPLTTQEREAHNANRQKEPEEVVEILRATCAHVLEFTRRVGKWLWIEFPAKPDAETRYKVNLAGFSWNNTRGVWQNPCGRWTPRARNYDPREKYGEEPILAGADDQRRAAA